MEEKRRHPEESLRKQIRQNNDKGNKNNKKQDPRRTHTQEDEKQNSTIIR